MFERRPQRFRASAGGARYVDGGGIIGPPPLKAGTTRLYLAGDTGEVASLFAGSALDVVSLAGAPPAASALKMTYAAWTKTTAALLISIRRSAAAFGVEDDPTREWAISQPDLPAAWLRARQQSNEKGRRTFTARLPPNLGGDTPFTPSRESREEPQRVVALHAP